MRFKLHRGLIRKAPLLCVLAFVAFSSQAWAADPDAPPGAPPTWLPSTPWVMDHWLPYQESTLYSVLHTSRTDLLAWLGSHDDRAPLLQFAREQGVPTGGLAQRLVGPRPASMPVAVYRTLIDHAQTTLTQPHLAHHMLGHLFHVGTLLKLMPQVYGLAWHQIDELHIGYGMSFAQIASRQGLNPSSMAAELASALQATEARGVALRQTSSTQAAVWLGEQQKDFKSWFYGGPTVRSSYQDGPLPPTGTAPHHTGVPRLQFTVDHGPLLYCHVLG